jgi:hypothetical protein
MIVSSWASDNGGSDTHDHETLETGSPRLCAAVVDHAEFGVRRHLGELRVDPSALMIDIGFSLP